MDYTKKLIDEIQYLSNKLLLSEQKVWHLEGQIKEYDKLKVEHERLLERLYPESNKLSFPPEKL